MDRCFNYISAPTSQFKKGDQTQVSSTVLLAVFAVTNNLVKRSELKFVE